LRAGALTMTDTIVRPGEKEEQKTEELPPYNVVLLDDNDHSYEYVILMLKRIFGHPVEKGYELAREVDATGRVVVATTNLEQAELKRDQIQAFGPDPLIPRCKGSMSATVEPASA
jgi:ATP-dependent Clp protease adaptor protein ClpS